WCASASSRSPRRRPNRGAERRAMRASPTRKLQLYVAAAAVGAVAGLALGLPQLVAIAAPFAVYVAVGLVLTRKPQLTIEVTVARRRALEDEPVLVCLTVMAGSAVDGLALERALGAGVDVAAAARRGRPMRDRPRAAREPLGRLRPRLPPRSRNGPIRADQIRTV